MIEWNRFFFIDLVGGKTTKTAGLGLDISDEELKEYFEQYGTVTNVKQIIKDTGMHKGVGFVEFEGIEQKVSVWNR